MAKADLEELYSLVSVGDTVELIGQRNDETASLFGDNPALPQHNPAVLAQSAPIADPAPEPSRSDLPAPVRANAAGSR